MAVTCLISAVEVNPTADGTHIACWSIVGVPFRHCCLLFGVGSRLVVVVVVGGGRRLHIANAVPDVVTLLAHKAFTTRRRHHLSHPTG